jgi:YHS domain-containing protein
MTVVNVFGKKLSFGTLVLLSMFLLTASLFAQEKVEAKTNVQTETKAAQTGQTIKKEAVKEDNTPVNSVCLVSHEDVDPTITYKYEGKTYAFCCNKCLAKFKKDPEKYISRSEKDSEIDTKKSEETK